MNYTPVNIVAVMAKHPELTKVKTRLAKSIGNEKALEVYKLLLDNLCDNCIPSKKNSFSLGCFLTPPKLIPEFQTLYDSFAFYNRQDGTDLGERMMNAFQNIFSTQNAEKAILIGADIPHLNRDIIEDAFKNLTTHDIVLGPTDDGGYFLIGMKKMYTELFKKITWGTDKVLDETLQVCKRFSLQVKLLETLSDLDNAEDLESYPEIVKKMQ